MITALPNWIEILFLGIWLLTIVLFYYSNSKPKKLTVLLIFWSVINSILAYTGFYNDTESIPPRFALVLVPSIALIVYGLLAKQRNWIYEQRNTKISTFLHAIRLPIEVVLLELFIHKMVPELMTFEGRNFDIIIGASAPIIGFLFLKNIVSKKGLLIWNVIGLLFVTFILFNGLLSAELPFQQFGFEQPNKAVMYFPFVLLPAVIVPIVIWTHLSDIIKLLKEIKTSIA
jgi:hypothetical protein